MNEFYKAFEDRHRGSRDLIKSRLAVYLPFLSQLNEVYSDINVLDLGCGRGEWLELMQHEGYHAVGVDIDEGMLEDCHELGLDVVNDDALNFLKQQEADSFEVISGFHIVEHIDFDDLRVLVSEALRVLKPAGLLIMETPNPENLVVGTNNFYLDPTHLKPIPSELLQFVAEYSGFKRAKVVRLQESVSLFEDNQLTLNDVLRGVSPDYAVVAQKTAEDFLLNGFKELFEKTFGASLTALTELYQSGQNKKFIELNKKVNKTQSEVKKTIKWIERVLDNKTAQDRSKDDRQPREEVSELLEVLKAELSTVRSERDKYLAQLEKLKDEKRSVQTELDQSLGNAHNWYIKSQTFEEQLNALTSSASWRITAPLRWSAKSVKVVASAVINVIKWPVVWLMKRLMAAILQDGKRAARINEFLLANAPLIHNHLRQFARHRELIPNEAQSVYVDSLEEPSELERSALTYDSLFFLKVMEEELASMKGNRDLK